MATALSGVAAFVAIASAQTVQGNPACWRSGYSFEICCFPEGEGNPDCFDGIYSYWRCCTDAQEGHDAVQFAAMAGDCRTPAETQQLPAPLRCAGTPFVSAGEWQDLFHAHKLSKSLGTSFKGWPNISALLDRANASRAALQASEGDCLFGLLTLILQNLPLIEKSKGHLAAMQAHNYVKRMQGFSGMQGQDCRWSEMTNHVMFSHYPTLFGSNTRLTSKCPSGLPRVYVYDTGDIAETPLSCARTGFWASEVYVDRFFRHSACREHDWERADFFFIPAYLTCWELQNPLGRLDVLDPAKQEAASSLANMVRSLPYWGKRDGLDHLFLFGASTWQLSSWREILSQSVILAVESRPVECTLDGDLCWHCQDCFQPWKDIVIPPVTPLPMATNLLIHAQPTGQRTLVMSWRGQHANSSDPAVRHAYRVTNETVRLALMDLDFLPNVSLGGPVSHYALIMGNTQFCLCPKGSSSYTSRVFEALFAGCVPVLLSDDVRLPFDHVVDWAEFSIRWPMERADESLYRHLRELQAERPEFVAGLLQRGAELRCWFDYFTLERDPFECSPYLAILRALEMRRSVMPRARPPYVSSSPTSVRDDV